MGWPLSKDVLQQNPETNFGKKSRMKKSRRKTKITWEGEVRKDSDKSLSTKKRGAAGTYWSDWRKEERGRHGQETGRRGIGGERRGSEEEEEE